MCPAAHLLNKIICDFLNLGIYSAFVFSKHIKFTSLNHFTSNLFGFYHHNIIYLITMRVFRKLEGKKLEVITFFSSFH